MPRRSILSATERESLLAIPAAGDELIRLYTFNEADLALIRQHRGAQNRLGFAVQPCGTYGNVIRILVPLTASDAIVDEGLAIIEAALTAVQSI